MENFALDYVVVDIARFLLNFLYLVFGIAGDYSVHERGGEMVCRLQPFYKRRVHFVDLGELCKTAVQLVAVVVYKLARDNGKSLGYIALETVVAAL